MNSLPIVSVASPPPVPSVASVTSYVSSTMDQWTQFVTTVQQDLLAAWKALGQEIAQEVSFVEQQWDHLLGINQNPQNQSPTGTVTQPGSDSGTGRGNSSGSGSGLGSGSSSMATINNTQNQLLNTIAKLATSGSGNGGGSSYGRSAPTAPTFGSNSPARRMTPMMDSPGSGSGSGSGCACCSDSGSSSFNAYGSGSGSGMSYHSGIPFGLRDVGSLYLSNPAPNGYTETHNVVRGESNKVTVDQSGSGSGGTLTISASGSGSASDTGSGSGSSSFSSSGGSGSYSGTTSVTASGNGKSQYSYNLAISGTYANGVFTISSETYNESGSYNTYQTNTWNYTSTGSSSSDEWDATGSGNYTLSWKAALNGSGQLVFSSYSYSDSDNYHYHEYSSDSSGDHTLSTYDTADSVNTSGSGTTASYTGSTTLNYYQDEHVANPPNDYYSQNNETDPVSGTADLSSLLAQSTSGWQWEAGASNATNYTFHGVSSENASVNETPEYQFTNNTRTFAVNSFNSSYNSSDSSHVVDDEPGVPCSGTGTDLFHRDETFTGTDNVTGSGSYGVGSGSGGVGTANANYQAVETGGYSAADTYASNNEQSSGYDSEGDPYVLTFNSGIQSTVSGNLTATHNFQDTGNGLALTSESFQGSGSGQINSQDSGTLNGEAFNDSSSTPENWNSSVSLPGNSTPVAVPDGMVGAFPGQDMVNPNNAFFGAPPPWPGQMPTTTPVRGIPGGVQNWYNKKVMEIGAAAQKKVVKLSVQRLVMGEIASNPKISGSFTLDQGQTFIIGLGRDKELNKSQAYYEKTMKGFGDTNIQLQSTQAQCTYAVDQTKPGGIQTRTGNVVVQYKIIFTFTSTTKGGQPITRVRDSLQGAIMFHDANLENMQLNP